MNAKFYQIFCVIKREDQRTFYVVKINYIFYPFLENLGNLG